MSDRFANNQYQEDQEDEEVQEYSYQKADRRKSLNDIEVKKQIDISLSKLTEILTPSSPISVNAMLTCLNMNEIKSQDPDFKKLKEIQKEASKEVAKFNEMLSSAFKECENKVRGNYSEMVKIKKTSRSVLEDLKAKMNKDFNGLY